MSSHQSQLPHCPPPEQVVSTMVVSSNNSSSSSATPQLDDPLTLPCGAILYNRLCKAPMTEGLADEYGRATNHHVTLYRTWAEESHCGLLITGNIQIDRRYLERPGNVCIDGPQDTVQLDRLRAYAAAGTTTSPRRSSSKTSSSSSSRSSNDGERIQQQQQPQHCWVQLSHPGRQANADVAVQSPSPSNIKLTNKLPPTPQPYEMTIDEIYTIQNKFAYAASICQQVGFTGVQLHSAHGYLLSSFLNPTANVRTDQYGGGVRNRARFLLETVRAVRTAVGPNYPIGVKLNSSDFQKAGFTHEEAIQVASWLDEAGIDLLDISGGNYENLATLGIEEEEEEDDADTQQQSSSAPQNYNKNNNRRKKRGTGAITITRESTVRREAYFLTYADAIAKVMKKTPLMVTGGFRSRRVMDEALRGGACKVIGIGRPLCVSPSCTARLLDGTIPILPLTEEEWDLPWYLFPLKFTSMGKLVKVGGWMMSHYENLLRLGDGFPPIDKPNLIAATIRMAIREKKAAKMLQGLPTDDPTLRRYNKKTSSSSSSSLASTSDNILPSKAIAVVVLVSVGIALAVRQLYPTR